MAARSLAVAAVIVASLIGGACRGATVGDDASARLATPYAIEPFHAVDLDGRDRSLETWKGKVTVVNVWATWCSPCRREIPALVALQSKYATQLLVIGLLQDNLTDDQGRSFGKSLGINYPVVASTFDIESRLPKVLALPMTFVLDEQSRLVSMYAGEIDPAQLEREVVRLIRIAQKPGG